jgi:O-6-methylguanine DNA methyltransferase
MTMTEVPIPTPDGVFTAHFSERGLTGLDFPTREAGTTARSIPAGEPSTPNVEPWRELTRQALCDALAVRPPGKLPPLDLSAGTVFQRQVWAALRRIPPGRTTTYGQLASVIGRPQAVRAVGRACGANPIPVLIPCHRVVQTGGGLGGFSGGLQWKRLLLAREGPR